MFFAQLTTGEKRPREEGTEGKVARAKMDTTTNGWGPRAGKYDLDGWCGQR
jgi:hypothetical protein